MRELRVDVLTAVMVLVVCITFFFVLFHGRAHGHSWYPQACCSGQDCSPLADDAVEEYTAGWRIKASGEFITRDKAAQSIDGSYHLCRTPQFKQIRCFFYPYRGT